MRIVLIADTHGFLDERIASMVSGSDAVIHAGDIGAAVVLNELHELAGKVVTVRGNNDLPQKWPDRDTANPADLPVENRLELPGGTLVVVHGDAWRARDRHLQLRHAFPEAGGVVYGHSHRLVIDRAARPWILNPGAAGRVRTYGGPSCLLLEADKTSWRVTKRRFNKR